MKGLLTSEESQHSRSHTQVIWFFDKENEEQSLRARLSRLPYDCHSLFVVIDGMRFGNKGPTFILVVFQVHRRRVSLSQAALPLVRGLDKMTLA